MNYLGWRSPLTVLNTGTLAVGTPLVFQVGLHSMVIPIV